MTARKITQNTAEPQTITANDSAANLTIALKILARELGFSKIGIAPAGVDSGYAQHLQEWLDRSYHGSMQWLAARQAERSDLFQYFPEARSVISVAMNYYTPPDDPPPDLKISNYALGEDYHDVLKKRLFRLLSRIRKSVPEVKSRICVDTSPVPDKHWARQAGLGWIGKNTNLITRDYGSWLFLGELIVDIPLQYDEVFRHDYCGSCQACLEACPTNALTEPYVLDARKCISYLTIEHRGEIAPELSNKFDGWIYGCDICQQVCPWNLRFQQETTEPAFKPWSDKLNFLQSPEIPLDEVIFKKRFKGNPIKRTGASRMERNIKTALKALEEKRGTK
ncbi:MAG: tRNA epoxyqueuosine(34) reductase QueG [FCB group bacterium]|nr:tRNA epoxyqueuosine(34) reductase QueG [FCB group bacterium]